MIKNAIPGLTYNRNLKPYNILENDDDTVEIEMYGEVVETQPVDWWTGEPVDGLYIVLSDFLKSLDGLKGKSAVTVRINSVGGDLFAGISIYNRLRELNNVTTIVDGLAASAASIILQAGSTRKAYKASQVMAHGASVGLCSYYNIQQLDAVRDELMAANEAVIGVYEETTGQSRTTLKHMIEKTTWMTGEEILNNGFADEIISGGEVKMKMAADKSLFLCNGIPLDPKKIWSLPTNVEIITGTQPDTDNKNSKNKGGHEMTLEELKKQHPELVTAIEDEARQTANASAIESERKRIKEIEEIENSIADKELVNEAKYGDKPMDAKELAFMAMKKNAHIGAEYLDSMKNETEKSGANDVGATPNSGGNELTKEQQAKKDIADGAALIAGKKGE